MLKLCCWYTKYIIAVISFSRIKMSVFEQLNPFVSLCQVCGLIPYTIEYNLITNKFSRFTFSIKHRTTWWFVGILALQLVSICFTSYLVKKTGPSYINRIYVLNQCCMSALSIQCCSVYKGIEIRTQNMS